ncbi:gliding motility-associated C-terminal domain-containing protein [uncultured Aquimarina sp.]|uniref:T9SS type B sorting domain-containing protein n=1 Tax=uncultured Aquimarina sp. TaxID=575652 RepID=UPI0026249F0D|nr:gliding motility-associated C-terminal domain-containing protein [uncultured Aquimarina sp.]
MKKQLLILVMIASAVNCSDNDDTPIAEKSCCSEDSYVIEINNLPEGSEIEPVKAFTPNADGFHDTFDIIGLQGFTNSSVKIFLNNNLVFETDNYDLEDSQNFSTSISDQNFDTRVYRYELQIDNGDVFKAMGYVCAVKVLTIDIPSSCAFGPLDPDPIIRN